MRKAPALVAVSAATVLLVFSCASAAQAAANPVDLRTAASFAVLAATTVTNTGPSIISGDIGLSPGSAVTGFPPGVQSAGATFVADAVAVQAQVDANAAFVAAANQPGTPGPAVAVLPELGGLTLTPDLYQSSGVLQITGTLTLDAEGDSAAIFVFRSLSALTTASASNVALINGASACNVYWIVPSSATLGTNSDLVGTVLAGASVTATTGADVIGRLIALTGAVTLDTNDITSTGCAPVYADGTPDDDAAAIAAAAAAAAAQAAADAAAQAAADAAAQAAADAAQAAADAAAEEAATTLAAAVVAAAAPSALAHAGPDDVLLVALVGGALLGGGVAAVVARRRLGSRLG